LRAVRGLFFDNFYRMAVLRKIALGLLLAAAAGVLGMAGWELWNYRQWSALPLGEPTLSAAQRARILSDRVDLLTRRVGDMQLLVLILLGTSGLYAIVFVASSYFSASSFARQADQTIANMQDQIGFALGDLRELQEQTEQRVKEMAAPAPVPPAPPPAVSAPAAEAPPPEDLRQWESRIAEIRARIASWHAGEAGESARIELIEDEARTIGLELSSAARDRTPLAELYLGFGQIYAGSDSARARFYLERALHLAAPESAVASQIHYSLACRYAASHEFPRAMRALAAAFQHQFWTLEERLAGDIEEGGPLYQLASTPPYDKTVNDLLLNMSIGIG
jgi:hypothetical protein